MTKQEIFDTVCTHLAKQQRRAVNAQGRCEYKNVQGQMCAVGCLFNDEEHRMTAGAVSSISGLVTGCRIALRSFFSEHKKLLMDLQKSHDCSDRGAEDLRGQLRWVATTHDLSPEAAEQVQVWNG